MVVRPVNRLLLQSGGSASASIIGILSRPEFHELFDMCEEPRFPSPTPSQLLGRGTKEHTPTRNVLFGREFFYLENYALSRRNACLERNKTPQDGNQVSPLLC